MEQAPQIESLPNYVQMIDRLMLRHRNDPLVSRKELDECLGERGNIEALLGVMTHRLGLLVHGSQLQMEEVEPRQAEDRGGVPENQLHAVYATDIPAIALNVGLVSSKKIYEQKKSLRWESGIEAVPEAGLRIPSFSASQPLQEVMGDAYVYVFEAANFEPTNSDPAKNYQFVATKPVRPLLVIPVKPGDFKHEVTIRQ